MICCTTLSNLRRCIWPALLLPLLLAGMAADAASRGPGAARAGRFDGWISPEPHRWPVDDRRSADIPLPPARQADRPAEQAADCVTELAADGIVVLAAAAPASAAAACQVEQPVRLMEVRPRSLPPVRIDGQPLLACAGARAVGRFLRDVVAPLVKGSEGRPLRTVSAPGGVECRPRNRQAGAKPSAHGRGIALDIAAFTLEGGDSVRIVDPGPRAALVRALRMAACGWFTTVLGPGSDPFHADHLHFDLETHGSSDRYRICD